MVEANVDSVYTSPEGLRAHLVAHALDLLEDSGLSGFTGREVARRAGVSHGAPRRHFPTLASLLASVAVVGFGDLASRLAAPGPETESEDPREALVRAGVLYVQFAQERPALFELMFRHDLLEGSGVNLREHSTAVFAQLVTLLARAGAADPHTAALDVWASIHGLATLHSRRGLEVISGEATETLVRRQVVAHVPRSDASP